MLHVLSDQNADLQLIGIVVKWLCRNLSNSFQQLMMMRFNLMKLFLTILIIGLFNIFNECNASNNYFNLESFSLLSTSYPDETYDLYSVYNNGSDYPDCIFVFGGKDDGANQGLYCFSISNNSLIEFDTIEIQSDGQYFPYAPGHPGALMWRNKTDNNDYIYYIFRQVKHPYIHRYNLQTRTDEYLETFAGWDRGACMQLNPFKNNEILLVESYGSEFGVYNIENNTFTEGDSLDERILRQACIVINNEYMNDEPYLYVFGYGYIQRLNLISGNITTNIQWQTLQLSLEVSDSRCDGNWTAGGTLRESTAILSGNLIYIIGGKDDITTVVDCIIAYNILTNNVNFVGLFPSTMRRSSAMLSVMFSVLFFVFVFVFVFVLFNVCILWL